MKWYCNQCIGINPCYLENDDDSVYGPKTCPIYPGVIVTPHWRIQQEPQEGEGYYKLSGEELQSFIVRISDLERDMKKLSNNHVLFAKDLARLNNRTQNMQCIIDALRGVFE